MEVLIADDEPNALKMLEAALSMWDYTVVSACDGKEAEERQIIAGCTEHLPKPIQTKELFETLEKFLRY